MRILVTGGAGFIASHVVDEYVRLGHQVVVLDNLSTGVQANVNPEAELIPGDVRDLEAVEAAIDRGPFDLLNHHAAQLDVRLSVRDPRFDAETNVIGSINVFESAVRSGVRNIIFASSGGTVYGNQEYFPADERHPTRPVSPYGAAKLAVESYLNVYMSQYGVRRAVLRYTNVYGPRQNRHGEAGVVAIFCDQLLTGGRPIINGDGTQTRDYVYIGDVVRANTLAMDALAAGDEGGVYNVCSDTETSVIELFRRLNHLLDTRRPETHGPGQPGEQLRSRCSYALIEHDLGWKPEVDLYEGLRETIAFYRSRANMS